MFQPRESEASGHGPADGVPGWRAAALTHAQIERDSAPQVLRRVRGLAERWDALRWKAEEKLAEVDLAPDLAEAIGSRRWFRGLGTFLSFRLPLAMGCGGEWRTWGQLRGFALVYGLLCLG